MSHRTIVRPRPAVSVADDRRREQHDNRHDRIQCTGGGQGGAVLVQEAVEERQREADGRAIEHAAQGGEARDRTLRFLSVG